MWLKPFSKINRRRRLPRWVLGGFRRPHATTARAPSWLPRLTVACAMCQDHRYAPVPTGDYYGLAAAYNGAAWSDVVLASPETAARLKAWQDEMKRQQARLQQWLDERGRALGKPAVADV